MADLLYTIKANTPKEGNVTLHPTDAIDVATNSASHRAETN